MKKVSTVLFARDPDDMTSRHALSYDVVQQDSCLSIGGADATSFLRAEGSFVSHNSQQLSGLGSTWYPTTARRRSS